MLQLSTNVQRRTKTRDRSIDFLSLSLSHFQLRGKLLYSKSVPTRSECKRNSRRVKPRRAFLKSARELKECKKKHFLNDIEEWFVKRYQRGHSFIEKHHESRIVA